MTENEPVTLNRFLATVRVGPCPPKARFGDLLAGSSEWSDADCAHLRRCPKCASFLQRLADRLGILLPASVQFIEDSAAAVAAGSVGAVEAATPTPPESTDAPLLGKLDALARRVEELFPLFHSVSKRLEFMDPEVSAISVGRTPGQIPPRARKLVSSTNRVATIGAIAATFLLGLWLGSSALFDRRSGGPESEFRPAGAIVPIDRLPQLGVSPLVTGRRLALVVGVSDAPGRASLFAAQDAHRFCEEVLIGQLGFTRGDIRLLTDLTQREARLQSVGVTGVPTAANLERGLDWLSNAARPGDMVIVYVASHGEVTDAANAQELALIMADGSRLSTTSVLERLIRIPNAVKLAIVDCCFSGAGVAALDNDVLATASDAGGVALVLTSSAPDERSWTDVPRRTGVFQAALREALAAADSSDTDGDGFLSARELLARIQDSSDRMLVAAPSLQTPQLTAFPSSYADLPLYAVRPLTADDYIQQLAKVPVLGPVTPNTPDFPVSAQFLPPAEIVVMAADPSDEVGERYYVYGGPKDAESSYLPTGYTPNGMAIAANPACEELPRSGARCLRADFQLSQQRSVGLSFLLDGTFRPSRSVDLLQAIGARQGERLLCRFWARSDTGTHVRFKVGGNAQGEYHDSLMMGGDTDILRLTSEWQLYEIDLTGKDLSSLITAFTSTCNRADNSTADVSLFLDDIYFVRAAASRQQ